MNNSTVKVDLYNTIIRIFSIFASSVFESDIFHSGTYVFPSQKTVNAKKVGKIQRKNNKITRLVKSTCAMAAIQNLYELP